MADDAEGTRARELIDWWTPLLLRMCVDLGVVAAFGRAERSVQEVADITATHGDTLARVIRLLASRGVFEGCLGDRYRLTDVGRLFLEDEPGSLIGFAAHRPQEIHAWAEAVHTLRTGEASFPVHFGQGTWDWFTANPESSAKFNQDMRRRTTTLLAVALPLFDWPDRGVVVDVGGGNGLLLERLLDAKPELRGVVFDQPHVVAEAEDLLRAADVADRVEVIGGDFFASVPAGGDIYVMASILHDWPDDEAARILERCRDAMGSSARLVLFEGVLGPGDEPDFMKGLDLHMAVMFGARERTREEWEQLLDRGGFALERVVPTPGLSWIEARPKG